MCHHKKKEGSPPPSTRHPLALSPSAPQDPYSCGAYSYLPPGSKRCYYHWLSHPVTGEAAVDAAQREAEGRSVVPQVCVVPRVRGVWCGAVV